MFTSLKGFSTRILHSSVRNACLWRCRFRDCDFSGTDFTNTYFEEIILEEITVDYLTRFDAELKNTWKSRTRPDEQDPDILRAIRLAYGRAELWSVMDRFLEKEKLQQRKHILWPQFRKEKSYLTFMIWLSSLISGWSSGYSTRPARILLIGILSSMLFALVYLIAGVPIDTGSAHPGWLDAIYFSFTTFVTLGYGDLHYKAEHPVLRLLSTSEAFIGAIIVSLFVVVLSRKIFR